MQVDTSYQHLNQSVKAQNEEAIPQPPPQPPLRDSEPTTKSFGQVRHEFERTNHAPDSAKEYRRQDHSRPPEAPDDQIDEIRLCIKLVGYSLRREKTPGKNGKTNKQNQHPDLK
jgi:hypothetical protein